MICLLNLDKTHLFCYNISKQRHLRHADTYTSFCLTQGLLFHTPKRKDWCRTQTPKTPKTPSNSTTSIRRRNSWVDAKNSSTILTFRSTPSKVSLVDSFPTLWYATKAKRVSESSQNGKRNKKSSRHPKTTIAASPFNNTNMAQRAANALWAISISLHNESRHMEQTLLMAALTCYICTGI